MHTADICDLFSFPNINKQANLRLLLNVQKLEVFQLQGGFAPPTQNQGSSPAYCSINTILLFMI